MKEDVFQPLRVTTPEHTAVKKEAKRGPAIWDTHGRRFLRGPVSLEWLVRAAALGHAAVVVGLECWYRAGLVRSAAFRLNLSRLAVAPGLHRSSARRGLKRLAQAGLVSVARPAGQRALVAIKVPKTDASVFGRASGEKEPAAGVEGGPTSDGHQDDTQVKMEEER